MKSKIKFVDLFAGIGGFHQAIMKTAFELNLDEPELVLVSEIDKFAIETYSVNYKVDKEKFENIRDINENDVPDHNFLFAGFPCQTFSNAGKKAGFLDEIRGTLFFEIVRILEAKKPKYILLENVKHLVNHDNGKTWELINEKLRMLGYRIPEIALILSPDDFGIPQDRKRVFIPGILDENYVLGDELPEFLDLDFGDEKHELANDSFFSIIESDGSKVSSEFNITDKKILLALEAWGDFIKHVKKPVGRTMPVIWVDEMMSNKLVPDHYADWKKKYIRDMRNVYIENKEFIDKWFVKYDVVNWSKREKKFEWHAGIDNTDIKKSFIQLRQSGIRCRKMHKFPTLVAMVQIPIIFDETKNAWRHLTPKETGRLQSFDDNFKTYGEISTSTTNKNFYSYKQFGNSVNVRVITIIQKKLLEYSNNEKR